MTDVWVAAKDKKSGKTYYYNKGTKKTQWTKPAGFDEGGASAPAKKAAAVDPNDNPAFWAEGKDPKSGKTYFYNKKTKKTSWKKPPCMVAAEADEDSEDDDDSDDEPVAKAKPAAKPVAEQWHEATDPKSGRTYWYNKVTKKTTWKDPHAAAQEEKKPAAKQMAYADSSDDDDQDSDNAAGSSDDDGDDSDGDMGGGDQMMQVKKGMQAEQMESGSGSEVEADDEHEFQFAKHRKGWFNRTFRTGETNTGILIFKRTLIKKALLKQNRSLDAEAVQAFKNVMSYMGDRKSKKGPIEHAKKMLRNLMIAPAGLRDEVYMQICKQTTGNPNIQSETKGWELMNFCLATFPPSKHLKGFLLDFVKKTLKDNPDTSIKALAMEAKTRLPKIVLLGQRKEVPSKLELTCLREMKPVTLRVNLVNGEFKEFMVDSYMLVKDVEELLVESYNISCITPFAMYEQAEANVERILEPKDRILDVLASWENAPIVDEAKLMSKKVEKKGRGDYMAHKDQDKKISFARIEYKTFLYKAKLVLKTSNKEIMADPEAVNLIYLQAVSDVVTDRYPSKDKDITVLAALQLQATFGDFEPSQHTDAWLAPKIADYIPKHLIYKKEKIQRNLSKEWEVKILAKYAKVKGFTALDAKLNYLDYVQEWTFYGATFFLVEQRQLKDYPSPLTLGINCEGVMLMHPQKKTVLENYQFTDIVTWGNSDEKFIIVVGNIVQQRKLIFKTSEGKNMNHLIHDYVKFKVKNK